MENIGVVTQKPSINTTGKWDYLDVLFESSEEFNEATAKMMTVLYKHNSEGKCIVTDEKGNKFLLDVVHSTYDTINNIIRLFPYACFQLPEAESKKSIKEKSLVNKK